MKNILFILIFILGSQIATAQSEKDLVEYAIWSDETQSDQVRVEDLIDQINLLLNKGQAIISIPLIEKIPEFDIGRSSPKYRSFYLLAKATSYDWPNDQRLDTLMKSIKLADSVDYTLGLCLAYIYAGIYNNRNGDDSTALEYYNKAIEISKDPAEYHLIINKAWAETKAALIMIRRKNEELAAYYEQEAEHTFSLLEVDNPAMYYFFYYELGHTYQNTKQIDKAMVYYNKALPLMPEDDPRLFIRIAYLYEVQGEWAKALQYFEFSQKRYGKMNRRLDEYDAQIDMGRMLVKVMQLDRAKELANKLLIDSQNDETAFPRFKVYMLLGDIAKAKGNSKEALKHYNSSKAWITKNQDLEGGWWSSINNLSLGTTYLKEQNYTKAIQHCLACLPFYEEGAGPAETRLLYESLYESYKESGNKELALEYLEKLTDLKQDASPFERAKQLQQFEFDKKVLADSLQQVEKFLKAELAHETALRKNNRSKFFAFGIGGMILIMSIGLWGRLRFVRKTKIQLEEKNQKIEEEKERAMASEETKQRFLANMSHEIRTPMNAIKGMTDILLRREPQKDQLLYLNAIKESSVSLMVIINDILDFSKIEAGKVDLEKIPFSISKIIKNVCLIMQLRADEKGLMLQHDVHPSIPSRVIGDPTRLHQILLNLIGNAIKFTEKGIVSLEVKSLDYSDSKLENIQFIVSDTGVGIGVDRLDKIFESFEQAYSDTTRKFGGTGLGLSISKMLVELQNGEISVESQKGQGTQFEFSIPYEVSEETTAIKALSTIRTGFLDNLQGVKILLVEDNEFNAIVAKEELEDAIPDVEIDVAENGAIAVERVKLGNYDVVLMDVQMPVMNGHSATEKIRAFSSEKRDIPIIAMTANVLKEEIEHCMASGMNDFIGKPFDIDELIAKIEALV